MPVVDASALVECLAGGRHAIEVRERLLGSADELWAPHLVDAARSGHQPPRALHPPRDGPPTLLLMNQGQSGPSTRRLERWRAGAMRSRLEPIKRFARTVAEHRDGCLRWWTSRISNGLLEGLHSLVQAAKRRARGYRSTENDIAMIYLVAGKLDLPSTHRM